MKGTPDSASLAERIAGSLSRAGHEHALIRAQRHHRNAKAAGNAKRVDLYCAVCTIIADRDRVFSRSRL